MLKDGTSKISFCHSTCESTNLSIGLRLRLRPEAEAEAAVLDQLYYEQRKGNMFMAERCKMSSEAACKLLTWGAYSSGGCGKHL